MKISEIAKQTGLSVSTIRFYEKSGLCPPVVRGNDGQRAFSSSDADWLELLASLRATGMPLKDMRAFAEFYASGDAKIPERKAVLMAHQHRLDARQEDLDRCRLLLAHKLQRYDDIIANRP